MNISIVILAYNEERNLASVVREVDGELCNIRGEHEILIVNDGSSDRTGDVAATLQAEIDTVRVITHVKNLGLGGVYRTGFAEAQKDLLTFWPADGQFLPEIIGRFASLMGELDLVLGYLPNPKRGLVGSTLSLGEKALYRILFGRLPRFQGILMLRRSVLDEITLTSTGRGWAVIIEFIIRAYRGNYRVKSIPTDLRPRMDGDSKVVNLKTIASNFIQIVELRLRM